MNKNIPFDIFEKQTLWIMSYRLHWWQHRIYKCKNMTITYRGYSVVWRWMHLLVFLLVLRHTRYVTHFVSKMVTSPLLLKCCKFGAERDLLLCHTCFDIGPLFCGLISRNILIRLLQDVLETYTEPDPYECIIVDYV